MPLWQNILAHIPVRLLLYKKSAPLADFFKARFRCTRSAQMQQERGSQTTHWLVTEQSNK